MDRNKYMRATSTRSEFANPAGRFRGGKLAAVHCQSFRESESGMIEQTINLELDSAAGRLLSTVTAEVVCVYVPALAIDTMKNPDDATAGIGEIFREKLMQGVVFGLEEENEVTKRLGVQPRSFAGVKKVNEAVRLGHNCAVNYLRQRRHVKATLLDNTSMTMTPAIISQTVLSRFNAVLDPEDRINGSVNLSGHIPIEGISRSGNTSTGHGGVGASYDSDSYTFSRNGGDLSFDIDSGPDYASNIFANLDGAEQGLSLDQFYTAQKQHDITMQLRQIVDANPEHGEEIVALVAHGLSVETGRVPFIMYENSGPINPNIRAASDGASLDVMQTELNGIMNFSIVVPPTEFGGIVYTFVSVKPDETIQSQPHPILSDNWYGRNYVADELAIDPVPVTIRELDADCTSEQEGTRVFYTGNNHMLKRYVNYGFTRQTDASTVASQTAIWTMQIPYSVTPDSVIYPESLDHYPFKDQNAEVVQYNLRSVANIATPIIFGPTPIEELAAIETNDIFEDAE